MTDTKLDIPFGRPWIEDLERDAVMEVLSGHILTHGPNCHAFEEGFAKMMGSGHAVSTSSCMASLHLSWIDAGIGPGDEVLLPAMTHVATAHAVALTGATPVFVDAELTTGNMDMDDMAAKITDKTKAIGIVHYVGIPMDMVKVMALADKHDLLVVEDCALAVEARVDGTHVGLFGHTGCYSFYPVKHITCGEGGMLVSKDAETVKRIGEFRAFNYDRSGDGPKVPGLYDVKGLGMNYRMSEMQAALGRVQLTRLPEIMRIREANFRALQKGLTAIPNIHVLDSGEARLKSSFYCTIALLQGDLAERRNEIALALNAAGVGTSIYYPHPIGRLRYYRDRFGYDADRFKGATALADNAIALPCGPHLNESDMADIAACMARIV
ncbi:MAG: cell wall biogenesis protein [Rhodospirillaceae bacterium]|nr:cell wall biogenesis protein [Rhodospirillaceae bacterium]|tara:strand:+ start:90 stop:1235 length:1146 start_codon:yes stop_codon:yes gene_type:complete